jgi:hypothetical protein
VCEPQRATSVAQALSLRAVHGLAAHSVVVHLQVNICVSVRRSVEGSVIIVFHAAVLVLEKR